MAVSSMTERLLDNVEFVAFGVLQLDGVVPQVRRIRDPEHPGAGFDESVHCGADSLRSDRQRDVAPAADLQVEMYAVLGGFGFWNLLEPHPGPLSRGIDDRLRDVARTRGQLLRGTPMAAQYSRHVAWSPGGGSGTYPRASLQKATSLGGSAQSIVSCSVISISGA